VGLTEAARGMPSPGDDTGPTGPGAGQSPCPDGRLPARPPGRWWGDAGPRRPTGPGWRCTCALPRTPASERAATARAAGLEPGRLRAPAPSSSSIARPSATRKLVRQLAPTRGRGPDLHSVRSGPSNGVLLGNRRVEPARRPAAHRPGAAIPWGAARPAAAPVPPRALLLELERAAEEVTAHAATS
jgi:hypothetical protein